MQATFASANKQAHQHATELPRNGQQKKDGQRAHVPKTKHS